MRIMAKDKKSFVLYLDNRELFDDISDEDAGKLIKHIFSYVSDENPKPANITVKLLFIGIKSQLKRDLKKYEKVCKRNQDNGLKGGRPKNPDKPKEPSGLINNPTKPKKADSDNVNDNESDIYKEFSFFKDEFKTVWYKEYLPLKTKKKASKTDRALKSGLSKIKTLSNDNYDLALKILEKSVDSGWIDFYIVKNTNIIKKEMEIIKHVNIPFRDCPNADPELPDWKTRVGGKK